MTTRFTISATDYDYRITRIRLGRAGFDADIDTYADKSRDAFYREAYPVLQFEGVFEADNANAEGVGPFELWHRMVEEKVSNDNATTVKVDTDLSWTIDMLVDPSHDGPEALITDKGAKELETSLRLVAASSYALTNAKWDDIRDLTDPL